MHQIDVERHAWLMLILMERLQTLVFLGLKGHPPADAIEMVSMAWFETITDAQQGLDPALDSARIVKAFKTLQREMPTWPSPADFFRVLEPRPKMPELEDGRPKSILEMTPEQRAENMAWARKVKEQVAALAVQKDLNTAIGAGALGRRI